MDPSQHHNALNRHDRLHWYEIESILGQGGFGITYLARDTNLDQKVAIKEYLPSEFSTRDKENTVQPISENHTEIFDWGKQRFLDEARTLAQFRHPNVVRVSSFFENNNTGYMVMEYEEGTDLGVMIKAGESFDEKRLLNIILPVLDGLALVHEQGFIHRDIKPANIFIRDDGSPVLIDFGSARQAIGGQTKTLTSLVTPGFAPFEQYHDAEGKQIARSPSKVTEVRENCRPDLSEQERGEAENLTVGETAHWQRDEQVFHWLCAGIVSRIDPINVLRGDGVCRACVIAWWKKKKILLTTAGIVPATTVIIHKDPEPPASPDAPVQ